MTPWLPLVAAACGAIAGGSAAWMLEYWRRRRDSATLVNALVAELRHIQEHYGYAGPELPVNVPQSTTEELTLRKALMWSRYGDLGSAKDFYRYGFLGAAQIQLLLQISFRTRNTDVFVGLLLEDVKNATSASIDQLRSRMGYISASAKQLLDYLIEHNPRFSAFEKVDSGKKLRQ